MQGPVQCKYLKAERRQTFSELLSDSGEACRPCYSEFLHLNPAVAELFQGQDLAEPKN